MVRLPLLPTALQLPTTRALSSSLFLSDLNTGLIDANLKGQFIMYHKVNASSAKMALLF